MIPDVIEVILKDAVGNLGNDVIESQRKKGLWASGATAASVHEQSQRTETQIKSQLVGSRTFSYLQNGRGPNKSGKPSRKMVEDLAIWLKYKGLDYSPWAVATNIAKHGVPVPNPHNAGGVLAEPLNVGRVKGLIEPRLRSELRKEFKSMFFNR